MPSNGNVTISRGRRGIAFSRRIKFNWRENLVRSGHRPLAMELAHGFVRAYANRFGTGCMVISSVSVSGQPTLLPPEKVTYHKHQQKHEHKITRMLHH